jgi:hypothetical protein
MGRGNPSLFSKKIVCTLDKRGGAPKDGRAANNVPFELKFANKNKKE